MDGALKEKIAALEARLQGLERIVIAYSGGADSTFLLALAHEVLGAKATAVIGWSALHPRREYESALETAAKIGVQCLTLPTEQMADPRFTENSPNRCYYCKQELFAKVRAHASREGAGWVVEGTTRDEAEGFRPGLQALAELGILSPLREAGLTKEQVRAASHARGLSTWNKPSDSCLATRIPYGERITAAQLERAARAEEFLHRHGVGQVRARVHGDVVRIEAALPDFSRFASDSFRCEVVCALKALGFTYVALDLEGYRTGSMDEVPSGKKSLRI